MESLNSRTFPLLMQANPAQLNGSQNNTIDPRFRVASPAIGVTPSNTLSSIRDSGGDYGIYATPNGIARPSPKRSSTVSTFGSNRSSQPTPTPMKKRNQASTVASTNNGRLNKIIADLFLLAGRTSEAVQWFAKLQYMDATRTYPPTVYAGTSSRYRSSRVLKM